MHQGRRSKDRPSTSNILMSRPLNCPELGGMSSKAWKDVSDATQPTAWFGSPLAARHTISVRMPQGIVSAVFVRKARLERRERRALGINCYRSWSSDADRKSAAVAARSSRPTKWMHRLHASGYRSHCETNTLQAEANGRRRDSVRQAWVANHVDEQLDQERF